MKSRIGSAVFLCPLIGSFILLTTARSQQSQNVVESAVFAGGCFWCMEAAFEEKEGIVSVVSGYIGGFKKNPTYEEVSAGKTGHAEAIQIRFDPKKTSYAKLLEIFWHNIDPIASNRQFCDFGNQYRSGIFYRDMHQKQLAEESKRKLGERPQFKDKIATEIAPASTFYPAEEYHQDFYRKNPIRYKAYRLGCGRDKLLREIWGDEITLH